MVETIGTHTAPRLLRGFIRQYKGSMRSNKIKKDAIIEIIAKHLNVDSSEIIKCHDLIMKYSVNTLMKKYNVEEFYKLLLPVMVVSNAWDRGIDCTVIYDDYTDFDKFEFFLNELLSNKDISYIGLSYLDLDSLRDLSRFIFDENMLSPDILKAGSPIGFYLLCQIYRVDPVAFDVIDKKLFSQLTCLELTSFILENVMLVNKYIGIIHGVESEGACYVLLADIEHSEEIPNLDNLMVVVKKFAKEGSYDLFRALTKVAGSLRSECENFNRHFLFLVELTKINDEAPQLECMKYMDKSFIDKIRKGVKQ